MGIERWARADDGTPLRIVFTDPPAPDVAVGRQAAIVPDWPTGDGDGPDWWPPMGLTPLAAAPAAVGPDQVEVHVDRSAATWADRLESDLGLVAAEHLRHVVAVHAAVIEADGRLLVLPGPSFTGKSSLCAAAVAAGHRVWSDEYALIDPATGEVTGWPRRIKLRGSDGRSHRIDIGSQMREPRRADRLVFVSFDERQASGLEVHPITPGDAAMRLLENTVCAQTRPAESLAAATALARSCEASAGIRGDATDALPALFA